jgi:outer membrane protein OmpA-like peptidoglycan-associated protein
MKWLSSSAPKKVRQEDHWIPLSDLMTGLMMMFLLVAVIFMVKVEAEAKNVRELQHQAEAQAQRMRDVAILYDRMREQLFRDLEAEFRSDLPRWRASLDKDLTIRFEEPEVLFDTGRAVLKPQFIAILNDFFPRYVRILSSEMYQDSVEEIRIEGHTSSFWTGATADEAYFRNMELSQSRTRTTLQHVLGLPQISNQRRWLVARLTANGLSSSRLRTNPDGSENREASQRVEFRVRTNAEGRIGEILRVGVQ